MKTSQALKTLKLPGTVTTTALILPKNMSEKEIEAMLEMIGQIGVSIGWWAIDAVLYAEAKLSEEKFYQIIDALQLKPHTLQNMLSVGRAFPPKRRRADLALGHHEAVAKLDADDQAHWLDKAAEGDRLPNGESQRWSVARLRKELGALSGGSVTVAGDGADSVKVHTPSHVLSEGMEIGVRWAEAGVIAYRIQKVEEAEGILKVEGKRV